MKKNILIGGLFLLLGLAFYSFTNSEEKATKVNEAERHLNEFKAVQNQPSFQQRLNLYKIKIKPSTKKN